MPDRFMSRLSVSLGAGASTTVAHNIVVNGVATAPQVVLADRMTTVQVDTVTSTSVTFSNPGKATGTAIFLCWFVHSVQATPGDTTPGVYYKGETGGGVDTDAFVATNEFYIDTTATTNTARRIYPTIAEAYATGVSALPATKPYVIRLREGQTHLWDGTGFDVTREGTIYSTGGRHTTILSVVGGLTLPAGSTTLTLQNLRVFGPAATASTDGHTINAKGCSLVVSSWSGTTTGSLVLLDESETLGTSFSTLVVRARNTRLGGGTYGSTSSGDFNAVECSIDGMTFGATTTLTLALSNCVVTHDGLAGTPLFDKISSATVQQTTIRAGVIVSSSLFVGTGSASLEDVSINTAISAAQTFTLFDLTTVAVRDVRLAWTGGMVNFDGAVVVDPTAPFGFIVHNTAITNQPSGTYFDNGAGFVAVEP